MRRCSHLVDRSERLREVVAVHRVRRRAPEPAVLRQRLTVGVHDRAVVEAEHLPAHDRRLLGQVGEGDRPQDALELADDVVVEQQDVVGDVLGDRLAHRRGRSLRTRRGWAAR